MSALEVEQKEEKKKGSIDEEQVSLLLQRYSYTTIITLFQEISQIPGPQIDWDALVKRTASGITRARECQMLWRHLAYGDALLLKVEDEAEPLDDDSDLEFEMKAVPAANEEALSEAVSCVKVMLSSSSPCEPGSTNRTNVEAHSTNIENDRLLCFSSDKKQPLAATHASHATLPSSVHKRTLPNGSSSERLDGNGSAVSIYPMKKKRKLWSKDEDAKLITAVQESGEGNWAMITKSVFLHERTAAQLAQRWSVLRKKDVSLASSGSKSACLIRAEERLAAHKAISLALDKPKTGRLSAILSGATRPVTPASSLARQVAISDALRVSDPQPVNQLSHVPAQAKLKKVTLNPPIKSQTTPKVPEATPLQPLEGQKSLIQAAAFAAGGRLATPSTAASILRAAHFKNALHIRPAGDSNAKTIPPNPAAVPWATVVRSSRPSPTTISSLLPNSISVPTCLNQGGHQKQGCPVNLALNTLNSIGGRNLETFSGSNSVLCHENSDGNTNTDLSGEVAKASGNIVSAIEGSQTDVPSLMMSMRGSNTSNGTSNAQESIEKPTDPSKSVVTGSKILAARVDALNAEAAEHKASEVDADGNHVDCMEGTVMVDNKSCKGPKSIAPPDG